MQQKTDTSEKGLEAIIEAYLCEQASYQHAFSTEYDRTLCINKEHLIKFLETTQPEKLQVLQKRGIDKFFKRLSDQIKKKGIIELLRKGIKDLDLKINLYYKKPSSTLNKHAIKRYQQNIFAVCRQLYYSNNNKNSLDMVLFLNGLPIITMELKNHYTGQNVKHAIKQYQEDRDPKEPLFHFGRCIVHFAVDPDLVYMTTKLIGKNSFFLPFNKGLGNGNPYPKENPRGAGNPVNPNGLKSDYLWKEILSKPSLSNILENFVQVVEEKDEDTGKKKPPKLIFPRYHQLRSVMKLIEDASENGVGKRYLIQHSAGSGKSNSITWLAHRLTELHDDQNQNIFDSVIVITDRRVLDKQIRDNIKQFAQVKGVVEAITQGSKQLKLALEEGKKIIITTIQKFPYIASEIGELGSKNFAIIIDEAHSSQSGETASKMNLTLADKNPINLEGHSVTDDSADYYEDIDEALDTEDLINAFMQQRKMLKNASYFAFTATPKNKTLEVFGERKSDGKFYPFDLYSMKQAIEEEFILDVLKNYTTYQSYYKLNKAVEGNPEFEISRAQKKLRAFVESHPFSILEKTKIMVDHFHTEVRSRIKGKAKAMVVTKSIRNAIKYFFAFQEYLKEKNYPYKPIVAFSGKKTIDGIEYDEAKLNNFPSNDIPKEFKKNEYRFLIPKIKPMQPEDFAKGVLEAVELDSYRLTKTTTDDIKLSGGGEIDPTPPSTRGGKPEPEMDELDEIIKSFNERFGSGVNWLKDDKVKKVMFEEIPNQMAQDIKHMENMRNSDRQNARIASDNKLNELVQDFIFTSTDFYKMFTHNQDFKKEYMQFVFEKMWEKMGDSRTNV